MRITKEHDQKNTNIEPKHYSTLKNMTIVRLHQQHLNLQSTHQYHLCLLQEVENHQNVVKDRMDTRPNHMPFFLENNIRIIRIITNNEKKWFSGTDARKFQLRL